MKDAGIWEERGTSDGSRHLRSPAGLSPVYPTGSTCRRGPRRAAAVHKEPIATHASPTKSRLLLSDSPHRMKRTSARQQTVRRMACIAAHPTVSQRSTGRVTPGRISSVGSAVAGDALEVRSLARRALPTAAVACSGGPLQRPVAVWSHTAVSLSPVYPTRDSCCQRLTCGRALEFLDHIPQAHWDGVRNLNTEVVAL